MIENQNIILSIEDVCKIFGNQVVLNGINLNVAVGEFVSIVGPSGCGKSTLFKSILGISPPTSGTVTVFTGPNQTYPKVINNPSRDIGIVTQKYSLYKHLNAIENVAFGLMLDESEIWHRIISWIPFKIFGVPCSE